MRVPHSLLRYTAGVELKNTNACTKPPRENRRLTLFRYRAPCCTVAHSSGVAYRDNVDCPTRASSWRRVSAGVDRLLDSSIVILIRLKTRRGDQWRW
jgi:hypothetical protein